MFAMPKVYKIADNYSIRFVVRVKANMNDSGTSILIKIEFRG